MSETTEIQELQQQKSSKKNKSDSHKSYSEPDINTELTDVDSDIPVSKKEVKDTESKQELKTKLSSLVHPSRMKKKKPAIAPTKPTKLNVKVIGKPKTKSINFF